MTDDSNNDERVEPLGGAEPLETEPDSPTERLKGWSSEKGEQISGVLAAPDYVMGMRALFATVLVAALLPLSVVLRVLPASWRVYSKINKWSAYQMQKAASADAVANVRLKSGREDIRPAKWVAGDEDEKDRSGWKIKGVEGRFDPSVNKRDTLRYGKADILHLDSDESEVGTWAEATMDNAMQLDRERYLFRDAVVKAVFDVGDGTSEVADEAALAADRKRAVRLNLKAVAVAVPVSIAVYGVGVFVV